MGTIYDGAFDKLDVMAGLFGSAKQVLQRGQGVADLRKFLSQRAIGFEPTTSSLGSRGSRFLTPLMTTTYTVPVIYLRELSTALNRRF